MKKEKGIDIEYLTDMIKEVVKDVLAEQQSEPVFIQTQDALVQSAEIQEVRKAFETNFNAKMLWNDINKTDGIFMAKEIDSVENGDIKLGKNIAVGISDCNGMYRFDPQDGIMVPYFPEKPMFIGDSTRPLGVYVPFSSGSDGYYIASKIFNIHE